METVLWNFTKAGIIKTGKVEIFKNGRSLKRRILKESALDAIQNKQKYARARQSTLLRVGGRGDHGARSFSLHPPFGSR